MVTAPKVTPLSTEGAHEASGASEGVCDPCRQQNTNMVAEC